MSRRRQRDRGEYDQPWRRVDLSGKRCMLQILDPATAFDLEPQLVAVLGDALSLTAAAPTEILGAVWRRSVAGAGGIDLRDLVNDPVCGPAAAVQSITSLGTLLSTCIAEARLDPAWVRHMFAALVLGRLEVGGELVETSADWMRANMRPVSKWQAMAAQLQQTFGPLWLRSPYSVRSTHKDYGVPKPKDVPIAVAWADNLARCGSAGSAREILREWTPVEMIEIVENAAYTAEHEKRAHAAASKASG